MVLSVNKLDQRIKRNPNMRKTLRILAALVLALLLSALVSCGGSSGGGESSGTSLGARVELASSASRLDPGDTAVISATVYNSDGARASDGTVVRLAANDGSFDDDSPTTAGGVATAFYTAPGNTGIVNITATAEGVSASINIQIGN